jgi:hypothetical protein
MIVAPISVSNFFDIARLKSLVSFGCGLLVGADMYKILSGKNLQAKYCGIRSYLRTRELQLPGACLASLPDVSQA